MIIIIRLDYIDIIYLLLLYRYYILYRLFVRNWNVGYPGWPVFIVVAFHAGGSDSILHQSLQF